MEPEARAARQRDRLGDTKVEIVDIVEAELIEVGNECRLPNPSRVFRTAVGSSIRGR
jgi:hypothetical protein